LVLREQRLFQQEFGRIRDVRRVDNTTFYLLTDSDQGQLIRIRDLL